MVRSKDMLSHDEPRNNCGLITGTPVQGYVKRQLSDNWVPAQLWIISQVGTNLYTIENANSRTYMDLGMLFRTHTHECTHETGPGAKPNGTPILGRPGTGSDHQKWVITQGTHSSAYVYVKTLLFRKPLLIICTL
jgi:hypothetical protein